LTDRDGFGHGLYVARRPVLPAALAGGLLATSLSAQPPADVVVDWPQWGGPTRDFQYPSARIAGTWPETGPQRLWERPLGEGYSGIAAVGDVLYTMLRRGDAEVTVALDAGTGETRWEHGYPAPFLDDMNLEQGPGPHATPLVHRGRVYAVGATGRLHALDAQTGAVVWQRRLIEDLGGGLITRGYSCSPLAHGDRIIVQTGGAGGAVIAFDAATGRIEWRGGSFHNGNASPILVSIGGEDQVVAVGGTVVVGLDAATGETRWTHPHPHRFSDNIPTPLWSDGLLFVTSYADGGSRVLELTRDGTRTEARERWHHTRLRLYYTNLVRIGDRVYGSSGDLGPTFFTAADARTGEVHWQTRDVARSSVIASDGRLILRDEDGRLILAVPGDDGLDIRAAVELLAAGPPTPPTLRGSTLFIRDRHAIMALDLR
jgi:outer membrane protein assembly factor BamB